MSLLLTSRFSMWMGWGPELTFLYNDAYAADTLGKKHPWALGKPAREVWAEIWADISPRIQQVLDTGVATWDEALLLFLERSGYREETYHTFSYSPLAGDDGATHGMFCVVMEETERVIAGRRLSTLQGFAAELMSTTRRDEVHDAVARSLRDSLDLPFTLTYLYDDGGSHARLASMTGITAGHPAAPLVIDVDDDQAAWPAGPMRTERGQMVVGDLGERFSNLPSGPWDTPPEQSLVVPIAQAGQERGAGFFVAALNPHRRLDEAYTGFVNLIAGQIASSLANARAYEDERMRAEALAELDLAKTTFFSNVSHELRTPLTLMLGPTEDLLAGTVGELTPVQREQLDLLHRNEMRLLKLVNTLLDFSRIEAGRVQLSYRRTDLPHFTAELASSFRAAIERVGVKLVVNTPPLPATAPHAYVDRDMWEKIVLNLLSNAFKHTFAGEIEVALELSSDERAVELRVRDTGIGIPEDQLPRLFDRFHRVPNARSRTHEGTGIGLALVQELARMHGGEISVKSVEGSGSTFTVRIPLGSAHLAADRIDAERTQVPTHVGSNAYAAEARRWLPLESDGYAGETARDGETSVALDAFGVGQESDGDLSAPGSARILLADDNADMRGYVARLLRGRGWSVQLALDGVEALEAITRSMSDVSEHGFDLVLSDVMMPRLDGFGLLQAIRADPATRRIPVILLSARAGEEARVEGLDSGADDYLAKPFSARELIARVGAHLTLARVREQAIAEVEEARAALEAANEQLQEQASELEVQAEELVATTEELTSRTQEAEAANRAKSDFLAAMSHELRTPLNAIGGYAELLELEIHGPITHTQRDALQRIQRSEQHLLSLINDVLNFAKLEAGRVEYDVADVKLASIVADVMPMIEPQLRTNSLSYDVDVHPDLVVSADREKLRQILLNLLSNAVKFTAAGGHVAITAAAGNGDRNNGDHAVHTSCVYLNVSDTGAGIPADKQEAIFDPFVQVHRNLTQSTAGTGLGLAISRDLARGMGADIGVESVEGKGSTFTVTLRGGNGASKTR